VFVAQESPPAGGAQFGQIVIAGLMFTAVFLPLAVFVLRERAGKRTVFGRVADWMGDFSGLPRWAALPMFVAFLSGMSALIGVYWDVPIHMELGRDEGPLANPSHYPIYFGLMGIFASGVLSATLATKNLPKRTFKIGPHWKAPMGSIQMMATGLVGIAGFPLDDVWHRLFGQDVTEWGPTHVLMIGGVVFSIFARLLAIAEVEQLAGPNKRRLFQEIVSVGALLIAWDLFSTEFNYGVPQFPLILQPLLIVFGAAMAFTILRARRGPGTTFAALAVYLVIRGGIAWAVAEPLGEIVGHFPLLVVEALLVEAAAFALGNKNRFRLGAVAGLLIGTVGVVAEYAWSHVWMPIAWPSSLLPSAIGYGVVVGAGAGLIGAWLATRYAEVAGEERAIGIKHIRPVAVRRTHQLGAAGLVAVVATVFFCVPRTADAGVSGVVSLERVATGAEPAAYVTITLTPADAADGARWFEALAWQGGGLVFHPMEKVADGTYRSADPLPMYGKWKSMIRLHQGRRDMVASWVYAPEDPAIEKPAIQVSNGQTVEFVNEQQVLRREERTDVPRWMWNAGYALLAVVGLLEVIAIAWLVGRGARGGRMRAAHLAEGERERETA